MNISAEQLIYLSLAIALVPSVLGVLTAYLKVSIVLGMLRNALGTQQTPSGLLVMAISFAFTWMIMSPVFLSTYERWNAKQSVFSKGLTKENVEVLKDIFKPWQDFLKAHAGEREKVFIKETIKEPTTDDDWRVLIPSFILTELKEAFAMALMLLLPFAVIDIVVANILGGMGMFMVSPTLISLPLKLLVFTTSDAWLFLSKALVGSYSGGLGV